MDPVTQQYYLRARFYNPVIARFTQEDTYRGDGLNLYAYCANNPVYYTDPTGRLSQCVKDAYAKLAKEQGIDLEHADFDTKQRLMADAINTVKRAQQSQGSSSDGHTPEVLYVTPGPDSIVFDRKIPDGLIENPFRSGSYGVKDPDTGKFREVLRLDPATPPNKKGPNYSHYHLNGGKEHFSPRRGDSDPWKDGFFP